MLASGLVVTALQAAPLKKSERVKDAHVPQIEADTVWLSQTFEGEPQCTPKQKISKIEKALLKLKKQKVTVIEKKEVPMPVCSACKICPSYIIEVKIRVYVNQVPVAGKYNWLRIHKKK